MRRPRAIELEPGDIQGDILRAYGNSYDCTTYVFVHVEGTPQEGLPGSARCSTTTAAAPRTHGKPAATLNVKISRRVRCLACTHDRHRIPPSHARRHDERG